MNILARAQRDWARLSQKFSDELITIIAPSGESVEVKGLQTRHNVGISTDGQLVQTPNAHITVAESLLVDYPVRNTSNVVTMFGHRVNFKDNRGVVRQYSVTEVYPDETVGVLTLILDDFVGTTDFSNDFNDDFAS